MKLSKAQIELLRKIDKGGFIYWQSKVRYTNRLGERMKICPSLFVSGEIYKKVEVRTFYFLQRRGFLTPRINSLGRHDENHFSGAYVLTDEGRKALEEKHEAD